MMPVMFFGHGSPENAYFYNDFTRSVSALGKTIPAPRAIVCISAHWLTEGTFVTGMQKPRTIHDFYGFPEKLYGINYPAPGSPEIAREVQKKIRRAKVGWDTKWELDHGTWVILRLLYPKANIPVVQLSIDYYQPPEFHYELGKELAELRREGILIIGSGNIVHNLGELDFSDLDAKPFDWAKEFDGFVKKALDKRDHRALINYQKLGKLAVRSHPTPDHYYPLLYAIALQDKDEGISYPYEGFHYGSISMRAVKID